MSSTRRQAPLASVFFGLLLAAGCTPSQLGQLRGMTYPREFNYVERSEIQSRMGGLAWRAHELDRLLARPEPPDREHITSLLEGMQSELALLGRRGWPSNHPGFGATAEQFRSELARARQHVERDPPTYFWASTISQVCLRCHGYAQHRSAQASTGER